MKGFEHLSDQFSQMAVSPALTQQFESLAQVADSSALTGLTEKITKMSGVSAAIEDAFKPLSEMMSVDLGLGRLSEQLSQMAVSPALTQQFESLAQVADSSALTGLTEKMTKMSGVSAAIEDAFKPLSEMMSVDLGLGPLSEQLSQIAVADISDGIGGALGLADSLRLELKHIEALKHRLIDVWASLDLDGGFDEATAWPADEETAAGLSPQEARRAAALLFVLSLMYLLQVRTLIAVALEDVLKTANLVLTTYSHLRASSPGVAGAIELFTVLAAAQTLRSGGRDHQASGRESDEAD